MWLAGTPVSQETTGNKSCAERLAISGPWPIPARGSAVHIYRTGSSGMRKCSRCSRMLPFANFGNSKKNKDGYQSYCRACNAAHKREWIATNRQGVAINRLWSLYRLRPEQFEQMLRQQQGRCGICAKEFEGTPQVDHDHSCCATTKSCGKCVRGLLCGPCNIRLGWLETKEEAVNNYRAKASVSN